MTKKEYQERKRQIKDYYEAGDVDSAEAAALELIDELHTSKNYSYTVDLYHSNFLEQKDALWTFEVAYALNEERTYSEAEQIYKTILVKEPNNSAVLNNLSNIIKQQNKFDEAFDLIQRAYKINPKDEVVARNYETLLNIVREREERTSFYRAALEYLPKENEFVIQNYRHSFLIQKEIKTFEIMSYLFQNGNLRY